MARAATTSDVFNAIAEPQRRRILSLLKQGERPVNDVARELRITQPRASKHLRVLREVGLVRMREAGQQRMYALDAGGLKPVHAWVGGFEEFWSDTFDRLNDYLKQIEGEDKYMSATSKSATPESDREIVMTRTLDAPRDRVFAVWTDPTHVGNWYGPTGFTITTHEMDVRPGGVWRFIMHGPDGTDYDNHIEYREVVRPERLVLLHGSVADDPDAFDATVTFTDQGARTQVTMRMVFKTKEQRDQNIGIGAVELGNQTLGRLAEYVAGLAPSNATSRGGHGV